MNAQGDILDALDLAAEDGGGLNKGLAAVDLGERGEGGEGRDVELRRRVGRSCGDLMRLL